MSYNLLDENWIPVLYRDGRWERVGIRKALQDAGQLREVAASNPMDRVAVLRFLIALCIWLAEDSGEKRGSGVSVKWRDLLKERKEAFELLGTSSRFFQYKDAKRERTVTELLQEVPTGNNFVHFRHCIDGEEGLCLPCCAMGLLRLPMFNVSGLPGLKSGVNGVPPVYVVPIGETLDDTLKINCAGVTDAGTPLWEASSSKPRAGVPALLTGMTATARRVWLHDPVATDAACIGCGSRTGSLVLTCEFAAAGSLENKDWRDPHVLYQAARDNHAVRAQDLRSAMKMDRPWTALAAEISAKAWPAGTKAVFAVGFATNNANNVDVWERRWEIPQANSTPENIEQFRSWEEAGNKLAYRIRVPERDDFGECTAAITSIRPHVETLVSAAINAGAMGDAGSAYSPALLAVSKSLSPGVTTGAVERRKRIAGIRPDLTAKPKAEKGKKKQ